VSDLFGLVEQVNVTADHRIIYGGDLAVFLQTLAAIIEDPKDLTL
jgi:pyruvate dehydrogenase E2 component (dihydrolipoamide acetyltransferase)